MMMKTQKKSKKNKMILIAFFLSGFLTSPMSAATLTQQTIVGGGATTPPVRWNDPALTGPVSVVKDPTDGSIIYADNSSIFRVNDSGALSTILSGLTTTLHLAIDPSTGDVYGTDGVNIFKIPKGTDASLYYTTVSILGTTAGSFSATSFGGISGTNFSSTNYLDTLSGNAADTIAGIAYDYVSHIIYYSINSGQVGQINITNTPYVNTIITSAFSCQAGLTLNPARNLLYVIDGTTKTIRSISVPHTGAALALSSSTVVAGGSISGVTFTAGTDDAWRNNPGTPVTVGSSMLTAPSSVAVDSAGNVYVSDTISGSDYIGIISGGNITNYLGTTSGGSPVGTQLAGVNSLFVDDGDVLFATQAGGGALNLVHRIYYPGSISIRQGTSASVQTLNIPYYGTLNLTGGGQLTVGFSNHDTSYGNVSVNNASTLVINDGNALGLGGVGNNLTLSGSSVLKAGNNIGIDQAFSFTGSATIDTAGLNITLSKPFSKNGPATGSLNIVGGGTVAAQYNTTGGNATVNVSGGATLKLTTTQTSQLALIINVSSGTFEPLTSGMSIASITS